MTRPRIDLLDSFRFLAVMSVLFYHFTYRWDFLYPHGNFYGALFRFGYLGVNLFFVISGFVISYTLENTDSILSFFKNRFIRLFPPLLLCTLITVGLASVLDNDGLFSFAYRPGNLLPSLTMTNPEIWTRLAHRNFAWINGSYWSLWVELQFYVIASVLYFSDRKHFFRNMLLTGISISILKYLPPLFMQGRIAGHLPAGAVSFFTGWKQANQLFNIAFYMLWFELGVIFYHLYKRWPFRAHPWSRVYCVAVLGLLFSDHAVYSGWVLYVLIAILFGLLIYKKEYLSFLCLPIFKRIGVISYSMYLIHEVIGALLIRRFAKAPGWGPFIPLLLIGLTILFADLSYRFYERTMSIWLKRLFLRSPSTSRA